MRRLRVVTSLQVERYARRMTRWVGLCWVVACHAGEPWTPAATRDTKDDPAQLRPGYGNEELHVWSPLEAPEIEAIRGIERARQGDMHALLALAIVASADHASAEAHADYHARVDKFVAELKPTMSAADAWHKGYELNRAMHRVFFNGEKSDLGSYSLDQAFITGVFKTGTYNCISSAMLYTVLARGFELPVRAVFVPEHVFVEMDGEGKKILEVETTSETGFDWVHDERYFKEEAQSWSSKRGLKPGTLEDYQKREIVPPYVLMARGMRDGRTKESERARMAEIAALVAPEDSDTQLNVVGTYVEESNALADRKAWRTLAKMLDVVEPTIELIASRSKDPKVLAHVSWLHIYRERALIITGRADEAMAIMDADLKALDPKWPEYVKLRQNHIDTLSDHLWELVQNKEIDAAIKLITPRFELCKSDENCRRNLTLIYHNQMVEHERRGDRKASIQALEECVSLLPGKSICADDLAELR